MKSMELNMEINNSCVFIAFFLVMYPIMLVELFRSVF